MSCRELDSGELALFFYGEHGLVAHETIAQHLTSCAACREDLEELRVLRKALAPRRQRAEAAVVQWGPWMAALQARVDAIDHARASSAEPAAPVISAAAAGWVAALRALLRPRVVGTLAAAASVLLIIGLSVRDRLAMNRTEWLISQEKPLTESAALASLAEQHFQKSKLVVLGLMGKDPGSPGSVDWEYERRAAAALWSDTRLYRMAAQRQGLPGLAKVLSDLEIVMLQAGFAEHTDAETLTRIQRLIRARDLQLKIDTLEQRTRLSTGSSRDDAARAGA